MRVQDLGFRGLVLGRCFLRQVVSLDEAAALECDYVCI